MKIVYLHFVRFKGSTGPTKLPVSALHNTNALKLFSERRSSLGPSIAKRLSVLETRRQGCLENDSDTPTRGFVSRSVVTAPEAADSGDDQVDNVTVLNYF